MNRRRYVTLFGSAIVALTAAAVVPTSAFASDATYYAAPAVVGAGNCADPADACSAATAIGMTSDDDTVVLAGGSYAVSTLTISTGISLEAAAGASPVLHVSGGDGNGIEVSASSPVSIVGVAVTAASGAGIDVFGAGLVTLSGVTRRGTPMGLT